MASESDAKARLASLVRPGTRTLLDVLAITVEEASPQRMVLSMPVDWHVHQPFGYLHGGASAVLAESAASIGGQLALADPETQAVMGTELNISHLRSMREGTLRAEAVPVRLGRTSMVWQITLTDQLGRLIATSRCSLAVVSRRAQSAPSSSEETSGKR